jgi:hypothetical protein
MTELDRFEARFAAAYRRYLDEAPVTVDAVAVARAVAAQPRSRWVVRPFALRPVPAYAWLLLMGLLLAAAAAAAIFVGSSRPALAFACPPGSTPDQPGPADQARPPLAADQRATFDRRAGRVVLVAAEADGVASETWTFNVCTNTWTRMHPDREPGLVSGIVYDDRADLTIATAAATSTVWEYDLAADTWTEWGATPIAKSALAYDSAADLIVAAGENRGGDAATVPYLFATYDVRADAWRTVAMPAAFEENGGWARMLAYDASVDRVIDYGYAWGGVELLDVQTGAWVEPAAPFPGYKPYYGEMRLEVAYDDAAGRTIFAGLGQVIAFDAGAQRWELLDGLADPTAATGALGPTTRWGHSLVYDTVNRRLIVLGGGYNAADAGSHWRQGEPVRTDDVLAFDPATRTWIELLTTRDVVTLLP